MLTCTTRPMFPTHKTEGSIAPTDSRQYWGRRVYHLWVLGDQSWKEPRTWLPLHVTDFEIWMDAAVLLYKSRHSQDVLSTFHTVEPNCLKGRCYTCSDSHCLVACLPMLCSHFPSKYYHRRNGAPSKGQVAVLIPVNGSVLEVGSLWMLLRWPIGWSLIRFIRRGRAREMAQLVRYLLHSIKTRIKILSTHTQVRLDGTCL